MLRCLENLVWKNRHYLADSVTVYNPVQPIAPRYARNRGWRTRQRYIWIAHVIPRLFQHGGHVHYKQTNLPSDGLFTALTYSTLIPRPWRWRSTANLSTKIRQSRCSFALYTSDNCDCPNPTNSPLDLSTLTSTTYTLRLDGRVRELWKAQI